MIAVVQRVSRASVTVDGETTGAIARGLLVLLGVRKGNGDAQADVGSELSLIEELSKNYDAA